jgi:hypothetical protein
LHTGTALHEVVWFDEECPATGTGACSTIDQCKALCTAKGAPVYNWMYEKEHQSPAVFGCRCYTAAQRASFVPGGSGWTMCDSTKTAPPTPAPTPSPKFAILSNETGRCLGIRKYAPNARLAPVLVECNQSDQTQAWTFPNSARRIGAIQSSWAAATGAAATVLSVANSTLFGASHKTGEQPLLDAAFGQQLLGLSPYHPEPACDGRDCQDYDPTQSWYWSPSSGTVRLAAAAANGYRCYEPGCYHLTSHLPAYDEVSNTYCYALLYTVLLYTVLLYSEYEVSST